MCDCFYMHVISIYIIVGKNERGKLPGYRKKLINVYVHICINMDPCICVSPKVACFYEWYVSVY